MTVRSSPSTGADLLRLKINKLRSRHGDLLNTWPPEDRLVYWQLVRQLRQLEASPVAVPTERREEDDG